MFDVHRDTADKPPAVTVGQLVAEAAAREPAALAVWAADARLTYAELVGQALDLSARLAARGVRRGDVVGVCLERSAASVAAALAAMLAGAAYLPLDPAHPVARLRHMAGDAQARVVVTRGRGGGGTGSRGLDLDVADGTALRPPGADVSRDGSPSGDDLAYVVYTSGSTGAPKGVGVTHASLLGLVAWHRQAYGVTAADRATHLASPSFDAAVWEVWPYLGAGASLHVPDEATRLDPVGLRDWLVAREITLTFLPTALAEAVLTLPWPRGPLRAVLTGGEALRRRPPAGLPFRLVNHYGVTEATVVSTAGDVEPADATGADGPVEPPTIGRPIHPGGVRIVDAGLREVEVGQVGEIVVVGPPVAAGYLHQPLLGAGRFVADPQDARLPMYRTGDLARRRPDGELEFCGRRDDQVKLRGFRVEPGEVEAVLGRHPAVAAGAIVATPDSAGDLRLVAHVVPAAGCGKVAPDVLAHLAAALPAHMVPAAVLEHGALPLTVHGKVDRAALAAVDLTGPAAAERDSGVDDAPRTELEAAVAEVTAGVLGLERVARDDDFFLLGGHSMLGAQLVARLGERFGLAVSLRTVFACRTVAAMAAELERLLVEEIAGLPDDEAERQAQSLPRAGR